MTTRCQAEVMTGLASAIIALRGDVDGGAADILADAYDRAAAGTKAGAVVLDFASVGYINSTGIALIVSVLAKARSEGRKVVASGLSDHYREIFDITRLSDFIELFSTLDDAMIQLTTPAG